MRQGRIWTCLNAIKRNPIKQGKWAFRNLIKHFLEWGKTDSDKTELAKIPYYQNLEIDKSERAKMEFDKSERGKTEFDKSERAKTEFDIFYPRPESSI